jgi:epoxyqueuosine reductase QueG
MTTSAEIKAMARRSGADLCGIAPIERFKNAPNGFHPHNINKETRTVIAFAKHEPTSALFSQSPVPYTFTEEMVLRDVFRITMELVYKLEDKGHSAIPIPSEPYEYWDKEEMTGKGILSLKHIGYLAGLGVIGRNTLLVNKKYGNMIRLGAILTDAVLEGDPIEDFVFCKDNCNLCIKNCPSGAIDGKMVIQKNCRPESSILNKKGEMLYSCCYCRKVCPYRNGIKDEFIELPMKLSRVILVKNMMG